MMLHLLLELCLSSVRCYNQSRQNHLTLYSIKEFDCYHLPPQEPPQAISQVVMTENCTTWSEIIVGMTLPAFCLFRSFSVAFSSSYPHPTSIFSSLHSSNILYLCFRSPKWSWKKNWLWKSNSDSQLSSTTPVYSTPLGSLECAWPHLTCGSKQSCLCIGLKLLKIGHPI